MAGSFSGEDMDCESCGQNSLRPDGWIVLKVFWAPLLVSIFGASISLADGSAQAADVVCVSDISYAKPVSEIPAERFTLDVYRDPSTSGRPVVLYFHGGGFDRGGKEGVGLKPKAFVSAGYVFVAANRRYAVMPGPGNGFTDSAAALAWLVDHVDDHGGDPASIFLMGHSAGAGIAALIATDGNYLAAHGLKLTAIRGVVCVDTASYDKPAQVARAPRSTAVKMYRELKLTENELVRLSPVTHVAAGKCIPPFLLYHRDPRASGKSPTERFAARLREAGVEVEIGVARDRSHASIDALIGRPDDPVTAKILGFLARHTKQIPEEEGI
jgi:acetyl esterase/lipase